MAETIDFDLTGTPVDLIAGLSLKVGTVYAVQNASTTATARFRESDTAPAASARAFRIEAGGNLSIKANAPGDKIFAWTDAADGCPLVVSERVA